MRLAEFLEILGDQAAANLLGQKERTIRSWRSGARLPQLADTFDIQQKTKGRVTVEEMARDAWIRKQKRKGNQQAA